MAGIAAIGKGLGLFGGSSTKTDRNTQLASQQGLWKVFNQGFGQGTDSAAQGKEATTGALSGLDQAKSYWSELLTRGRTQTMADSAPATNAVLAQEDATRRQEGAMGTGRSGGTVAANRESGAAATKSIDDIINSNLVGGRAAAASGIESTSKAQGGIGAGLSGLSLGQENLARGAAGDIMSNAASSRATSYQINQQEGAGFAQLLLSSLGLFE